MLAATCTCPSHGCVAQLLCALTAWTASLPYGRLHTHTIADRCKGIVAHKVPTLSICLYRLYIHHILHTTQHGTIGLMKLPTLMRIRFHAGVIHNKIVEKCSSDAVKYLCGMLFIWVVQWGRLRTVASLKFISVGSFFTILWVEGICDGHFYHLQLALGHCGNIMR